MNDIESRAKIFTDMEPWTGFVPTGFLVDYLGIITDARIRAPLMPKSFDPDEAGGGIMPSWLPDLSDHAEGWIEAVNQFEVAQEARNRFVMITLGACYGSQAVSSYKALQAVNPLPCKLVAVEPEPGNFKLLLQHMRHNGIDPDDHWMINATINDTNDPVLFPVGSPGLGVHNCFSTNHASTRAYYADQIAESGRVEQSLRELLLHNSTGLKKELIEGYEFSAEIKYVSAVTLRDVLGPFDFVDYLEADIQQSEILVFPPFMELLKKKVRRIHIGTHGEDVHKELHRLFETEGWELIFSYEPNRTFDTPLGSFDTNDGVLTVRNPAVGGRRNATTF